MIRKNWIATKLLAKKIYRFTERIFEILTAIATSILGNSITFMIALCTVIYWLSNEKFYTEDIHSCITDILLAVTFLSLFIIQKSFSRFSTALHLKVNELVASHDSANNSVINVEEKTELEMTELTKEYIELALKVIIVKDEPE